MKYHKLVRDKVPEIIEKSGKRCEYEIVNVEESLKLLDQKLKEFVFVVADTELNADRSCSVWHAIPPYGMAM